MVNAHSSAAEMSRRERSEFPTFCMHVLRSGQVKTRSLKLQREVGGKVEFEWRAAGRCNAKVEDPAQSSKGDCHDIILHTIVVYGRMTAVISHPV